jgi:hypothetical protein
MMNYGDVERRMNRWWRRSRWCDEEPCDNDEPTTLQWCKSLHNVKRECERLCCTKRWWWLSRGHKCLAQSCWSTVTFRWHDLHINKIVSVNMNMVSPTGDAGSCARWPISSFWWSDHTRTSAVFTRSSDQGPCDHHVTWGWIRRSFAGVVPYGCVNPERTNEKSRKGNKAQCNSRRSDVSPSLPRENTNA